MADTYCTIVDVQNLVRWKYPVGATDEEVDQVDVQGYIEQTAGEINAVLKSKGIDVDSITSSKVLKLYNTLGASCLAESAQHRENDEAPRADRFCKLYEKALAKIERNPKMLLLEDVSSSDGFASFASSDEGVKKFLIDNNFQW